MCGLTKLYSEIYTCFFPNSISSWIYTETRLHNIYLGLYYHFTKFENKILRLMWNLAINKSSTIKLIKGAALKRPPVFPTHFFFFSPVFPQKAHVEYNKAL